LLNVRKNPTGGVSIEMAEPIGIGHNQNEWIIGTASKVFRQSRGKTLLKSFVVSFYLTIKWCS
jgi:hypothetical protein